MFWSSYPEKQIGKLIFENEYEELNYNKLITGINKRHNNSGEISDLKLLMYDNGNIVFNYTITLKNQTITF